MSSTLLSRLRRRRRTPRGTAESNDLSDSLVVVRDPAGPSAEAYRALRTNLLYSFLNSSPRVIVVSSPGPHEGKSAVAANLGVALAQITSTLIVDCDLRAPAMHKVFNTPNAMGLVDILIEERDLREVYHEPFPGLKMITAGPMFPSPTEFLSSERFAQFVDRAREQFEYVLMDSSPIHLTSDALIVARHCDGVLVVLDAENTRKVSLRQSVRSLESVGAKVLGTVMHNAKVSTSFDTAR